jgi:hypothetical protein
MCHEDEDELEGRLMNGTAANQAQLRAVAAEMEQEQDDSSPEASMTDEHHELVRNLAQEMMGKPAYSLAYLISLLEGLLGSRHLTSGEIYRIIDDHYEVHRNKLAARAFAVGLEMGRKTEATEP